MRGFFKFRFSKSVICATHIRKIFVSLFAIGLPVCRCAAQNRRQKSIFWRRNKQFFWLLHCDSLLKNFKRRARGNCTKILRISVYLGFYFVFSLFLYPNGTILQKPAIDSFARLFANTKILRSYALFSLLFCGGNACNTPQTATRNSLRWRLPYILLFLETCCLCGGSIVAITKNHRFCSPFCGIFTQISPFPVKINRWFFDEFFRKYED